jgi:hypothetical protein
MANQTKANMISEQDFISFVEDTLLNEIAGFAEGNSNSFDKFERMIIISWGYYVEGITEIPANITHFLTDAPGSEVLKVFFVKAGNKIANNDLPSLAFHRNFSGQFIISSKLSKITAPEVLFKTLNLDELDSNHIHSFLMNQFTNHQAF